MIWPPFGTVVEFQLNVYGGDEAKYFPSTRKFIQLTDGDLIWTEIGTVPETVAPVLGDVITAACVGIAVGVALGVAVRLGVAVGVGRRLLMANTVCADLVVPVTTLPKSRLSGLSSSRPFRFPSSMKATAGAAERIANKSRKLRTENAKVDDFGRNMADPPAEQRRDKRFAKARAVPCLSQTILRISRLVRLITPNDRRRNFSD